MLECYAMIKRNKVSEVIGMYHRDTVSDRAARGYGDTEITSALEPDFPTRFDAQVVVKYKSEVTPKQLVGHLRNLAACIEETGFFVDPTGVGGAALENEVAMLKEELRELKEDLRRVIADERCNEAVAAQFQGGDC
jgi:hypothetical protein